MKIQQLNQTIKIDIDKKRIRYSELYKDIGSLMRINKTRNAVLKIFTTRKGYHLYLNFEQTKFDAIEIVMMQLALGSDKKRELFNYKRIKEKNVPFWNVLFNVKLHVGKIISREEFYKKVFFELKEQKDLLIKETRKR